MRKAMLFLTVFALAASLWAADPFVGTWKLNLAKSRFNPDPPPQGGVIRIEEQDNGYIKWAADGVNSDGKTVHQECTAKYDGKDYPLTMTGGPPDLTIAIVRIDDNTHRVVIKRAGKESQTGLESVSKDGQTMSATSTGINAQGQKFSRARIFDRQ